MAESTVPSHNSSFPYLGVPAPAGTNDCYENMSWTPTRNAPSNQPRCRLSTGESCRVLDRRSMAHRENVVRGLVPRWGRGGAWQNPPCHFAVPIHNSVFSYPGVPAPAGMSDCYESMSRTTIRDALKRMSSAPGNPFIRHSGEGRESRGVGRGECSAVEDFARRGACPPLGPGWGMAEPAVPFRRTNPQLRLFTP